MNLQHLEEPSGSAIPILIIVSFESREFHGNSTHLCVLAVAAIPRRDVLMFGRAVGGRIRIHHRQARH
jgi:hypothetical protein